jgi:hypothetical protein
LRTDEKTWNQLAFPQFADFSKPVIEPRTGMTIYSSDPNAWNSSRLLALSANWYSGGTGWYISAPVIDLKTSCLQSQVNLNVPCAFEAPTQAMEATQVYAAGAVTTHNIRQRLAICLFQSVADVGRVVSVVHWIPMVEQVLLHDPRRELPGLSSNQQ